MAYKRWYPNATTLADGRVLVTSGSTASTTDYDPIPEIYDPATNTRASFRPSITALSVNRPCGPSTRTALPPNAAKCRAAQR